MGNGCSGALVCVGKRRHFGLGYIPFSSILRKVCVVVWKTLIGCRERGEVFFFFFGR